MSFCTYCMNSRLLKPLRIALQVYGREEQIRREDNERKAWAEKAKQYKLRIKQGDPEYEQDHRFDRLVAFLFPEIWIEMQAIGLAGKGQ